MIAAVCPTDDVHAPVEVVWDLLTHPAGWGTFFDLRILRIDPPGPAAVGQRVWCESGPRWLHLGFSFVFTFIDVEHHRLRFDVGFPLGIVVHEDLDCVPLGPARCRVNYRCNFELSNGWRGWLVQRLLGREMQSGPADSLARLKRAAEARVTGQP